MKRCARCSLSATAKLIINMKDDLRYFLNFNTVMFNRDLTFLCMIMTPRMTAIDLLLYHLNKLTIGLY